MRERVTAACLSLGVALMLTAGGGVASAQQPAAQPNPYVVKEPTAAPAGQYKLDQAHASVLARVTHGGGMSVSVLRFGAVAGSLAWDPVALENSKLTVTVDTREVSTPVKFLQLPTSERLLNAATFPEARFVSTSVRRTGPTSGQIMGDLTFRGVTRPAVIDAQLVGAGRSRQGVPTLGFSGTLKFDRRDFNFVTDSLGELVEIVIDVEFNRI